MNLDKFKEKIELGGIKLENDEFEEAVRIFEEVLKNDSENADVYYMLGNAYDGLYEFEKAVECYDQAININPKDFEAYNNLGTALIELGELQKAKKSFEQALSIEPSYVNSLLNMGNVLSLLENYEDALLYLDKVFNLENENPLAWYYKGNALSGLNDYNGAIECYDKSLEIETDATVLNDKGLAYLGLNELNKAKDCFMEAHQIDPDFTWPLSNLGAVFIELEKFKEALVYLDKTLEIDQEESGAWYYKGEALYGLSKYQEAIECYEKVLELEPEDVDAWNAKGFSNYVLDNFDTALDDFNRAIELDKDYIYAGINKGRLLRDMNKPDEALKCFEEIIEIDPEYEEAWYQKGNVYRDLKRENKSNQAYQKFIALVEAKRDSPLKLTASRVKEYLLNQKTGESIIVSPREKPWYWQWSTKPEYFLEADGSERKVLEPGVDLDPEEWWTCHKDTRAGDLVLLYRASKKGGVTYQDIKYLIMAKSDAYSITDDEYAFEQGWTYGCDYEVLFKFKNPIILSEIREDPYLNDWNAFRALFRSAAYKTELKHWNRLNDLLAERNPDYREYLKKPKSIEKIKQIKSELDIEDALYHNIQALKKFGYELEVLGRQVICKGEGGYMDLLCRNKKDGSFCVIELKIVPATQNTFAQISYYVAWVEERMAKTEPVNGLVISKGLDNKFKLSMKHDPTINHLELTQLLSELNMDLK